MRDHTTLRMNDLEGVSIQPADINEGIPDQQLDIIELELGYRWAEYEHKGNDLHMQEGGPLWPRL